MHLMRSTQSDLAFNLAGPSELASFHPDTFVVLEGFGTQCTKSDFYDLMQPDYSLVFTRNKQVHDARRNVWSNALSTNGELSRSRGDMILLLYGIANLLPG